MKRNSNQANRGLGFEAEIESYLEVYKMQGLALIEKLEVKKSAPDGKMIYLEDSPFDFMGAINPQIPVAFECKTKNVSNAKTAKFRMITEQELLEAKYRKKGHLVGIMPHQIDNLYRWVLVKGCGFLFLRVIQTGKMAGPGRFYGIVEGKTICKLWDEWRHHGRREVAFSECDLVLDSADFLKSITDLYLGEL